ncbi:hypothetical protein C7M61_003680 [Candidozyma pseudohaemuli]|uniref:Uncharacterized protein n=1 Tax=Candidozyma pseudohaemuli TaxID=418784 RepID=A0A2P7YLI5_9ASCO|nr:hypothetical protein C7M61_003680 [[Candida] pseudohaemulonii]PSK36816.1 hypothetical protein C7M61_003680 [[Candida] pseudohaemulonii]
MIGRSAAEFQRVTELSQQEGVPCNNVKLGQKFGKFFQRYCAHRAAKIDYKKPQNPTLPKSFSLTSSGDEGSTKTFLSREAEQGSFADVSSGFMDQDSKPDEAMSSDEPSEGIDENQAESNKAEEEADVDEELMDSVILEYLKNLLLLGTP